MIRGRVLMVLGLAIMLAGSSITVTAVRRSLHLRPVPVAARDIPALTLVSESDIRIERRPMRWMTPEVLLSLSEVVGRYTMAPVFAGETIHDARLLQPGADDRVSFRLEKNMRGFFLPLSRQTELGQALHPGDQVDIIWAHGPDRDREGFAVTILSGVTVIDLVGEGSPGAGDRHAGLLLSLSDIEAVKLALALDTGKLYPVIRATGAETAPLAGPVTLRDLLWRKQAPEMEGEYQWSPGR